MHRLVKITRDDDGEEIMSPTWCLVEVSQGEHALCTGVFFGSGESAAEFETKTVERGVPCPKCRAIIQAHKAIKL